MTPEFDKQLVRERLLLHKPVETEVSVILVDYSPGLRQNDHRHGHSSITVVLRGAVEEAVPRARVTARPFSMLAKRAGTLHENRYGPDGCKALQLNFAQGFDFRQLDFDVGRTKTDLTQRGRVALLDLLAPTDVPGAEERAIFALYELIADFSASPPTGHFAPHWLRRVKTTIDSSEAGTVFAMAALQREAGVHPVHLTRQFRRWYGCSVREYLRDRRDRMAADAVAQGDLPLTRIAHMFGYADQAHFSRCFRRFALTSPLGYRRNLVHLDTLGWNSSSDE
jgi:AraC family transcriptional regulator